MADELKLDRPEAPEPSGGDTGRTALAVVAAWVVPGLGHAVLGKFGRAAVFALLIWGTFGLGLAHDGRLALRDHKQPFLTSLQVVANNLHIHLPLLSDRSGRHRIGAVGATARGRDRGCHHRRVHCLGDPMVPVRALDAA